MICGNVEIYGKAQRFLEKSILFAEVEYIQKWDQQNLISQNFK